MSEEIVSIKDLTLDKNNANKGTKEGQLAVNNSLRNSGTGRSILVDKNGNVIAGNKTLKAAGITGIDDVQIVESDGSTLIAVMRTDLDIDSPEAQRLAVADNRTAEKGLEWDYDVLAGMAESGVDLEGLFDKDELAKMGVDSTPNDLESDGSLLATMDVTIDDPKHKVETGEIYHLGNHILLIVKVMKDWKIWSEYLEDDALFVPYPGPFVPLSKKAETTKMVMVQPNKYIAGHILDRYEERFGSDSVEAE